MEVNVPRETVPQKRGDTHMKKLIEDIGLDREDYILAGGFIALIVLGLSIWNIIGRFV